MTDAVCKSYDRLADEYTNRIFNELQPKPLDRQLLNRLAAQTGRIVSRLRRYWLLPNELVPK